MQNNDSFLVFKSEVEGFMARLIQSLQKVAKMHFTRTSAPQNLMSFSVQNNSMDLQLRFVVIGQGSDMTLGRLSWLDQRGYDHVCCYVNDDFKCMKRTENGLWREQNKCVDEACTHSLLAIKAA